MIATDITKESCSILTIVNGSSHRKAYVNSPAGRAAFMAECADVDNYDEVMDAWSDAPVVDDPEPEEAAPETPTLPERIDALEAGVMELAGLIAEVM